MKKWCFILIVTSFALLFCSCRFKADTTELVPEPTPALNEVREVVESGIVTFPDNNLEAAVRNALFIEGIRSEDKILADKPLDEPITKANLAKLTIMEAAGKNITSIQGLENCVNLKELYLPDNQISDIHNLSYLTDLTKLNLGANQIGDISPLASLSRLTVLDLYVNQIEDISPIASLTALTNLYLFRNQISDISPLVNLNNLIEIDLYANKISDISPLLDNAGLGKGDVVRLAGNKLDLQEGSEDMKNIQVLRDRVVVIILE
jgi:Leucine-rich repeat (LRR) protein